ncbi:MAG: hypothetical protein BV459_06785 [Thermoplasmata archaeon M11B2D]|nr:MAG: hypothetical protein BV459_06785 [Thermoplasmata archaeon M11B2D]
MKIAIITDRHYGVRNDSDIFYANQKRFYDSEFFPVLKKLGITTVIDGGDLTDKRKYVTQKTHERLIEYYERAESVGIVSHNIVGNHDCFWKNTNDLNSHSQFVSPRFDSVHVYEKPTEVKIGGLLFLFVPWITEDNYDACMRAIAGTRARVCVGHFEISGFKMYANSIECSSRISQDMFSKFDLVLSGHFHHKSTNGNIHYLGAPSQYTWSDCDDPRGFHILDTETLELEFVENPNTIFEKIYYDDSDFDMEDKENILTQFESLREQISDKYVKIVVVEKTDVVVYDSFVKFVESCNPVDLKVVDSSWVAEKQPQQQNINIEDTQQLLSSFVDESVNIRDDIKNQVKSLMKVLYREAISVGES